MSPVESSRRPRMDARSVYYLLEAGVTLLTTLTTTIYIVYYSTAAGLDLLQIMIAATVFESTIFLFEVPTGVVADVYSRRLSIIIGVALMGVGLTTMGLLPSFVGILLGEILMGIGSTFTSGATEAWITDEIGAAQANMAFVRAAQIRTVSSMIGMALSVALASIAIGVPVLASGVLLLGLALFLLLAMPENGFRRTPQDERSTWQTLWRTLRAGLRLVRGRPLLLAMFAIAALFAFHSEGIDHLWQLHFVENVTLPAIGGLKPVVWFGIIGIGASVLSLALNEVVRRRVNLQEHTSAARALRLVYVVIGLSVVVFGLSSSFVLALAAYWLVAALHSVAQPISRAWLNQNVESSVRATMFSLNSQVHSFGEMAAGVPMGVVGKVFSVRTAIVVSGAVLGLTLALFAYALRREPFGVEE